MPPRIRPSTESPVPSSHVSNQTGKPRLTRSIARRSTNGLSAEEWERKTPATGSERLRPAVERALEQLLRLVARERPDRRRVGSVQFEHPHGVLEQVVRRRERVVELEALEDVIVTTRLVGRAQVHVDRPADGPDGA